MMFCDKKPSIQVFISLILLINENDVEKESDNISRFKKSTKRQINKK